MMSILASVVPSSAAGPQPGGLEMLARTLEARLRDQPPARILGHSIREAFKGRIALVSSFGTESAVLLEIIARFEPATPVIFLNTGKHFPETLAYRDALAERLGLRDLRIVEPDPAELRAADADGELWRRDPDACCRLRKVLPLAAALDGFDAWITGRKQYQGSGRAGLRVFEAVGGRIKVNPLAAWSERRIQRSFDIRALPRHPLYGLGYASVGCAPCTVTVAPDAAARSGRWAGLEKTECGIHGNVPRTPDLASA